MTLRSLCFALVVLVVPLGSVDAAPKHPANNPQLAEAKAIFADAKKAFDAGKYADALDGFTRSHELSRNPILFFNMAACADKLGQTRVASAYLRAYLTEVPGTSDAEKIRERIGGLEERAKQEDERRAEEERRADEDARRRKEEDERRDNPVAVAVVTTPPPVEEHEPVAQRYKGGFIGLGVTAAFGIATAGLGGAAVAKYHSLDSSCGAAGCGSRVDGVRTEALVTDVLIGVTAAAAVTTVVLFALEARHHGGAR